MRTSQPDHDYYHIFHEQNGIPHHRHAYSDLAAYRRQGPIVLQTPADGPRAPGGNWITADHAASLDILRRPDVFLGDVIVPAIWLALGNSLIFLGGERHAALRRTFRGLFSKERLAGWEHSVLRPAAHAVIDGFAARGRGDLVADFASVFPHAVFTRLMGFDAAQAEEARRCGVEILCATTDLDLALRASERLTRCLRGAMADRRRAPRDDLITDVMGLRVEDGEGDRPLTEEEQLSFLRLLAPAGTETTSRAMANLLVGLLSAPEQLEALRADRALVPQAIEEGLRWETPVLRTLRRTVRPACVAGVDIPAGAWVHVSLGGANRDPRAFAEPDRFDILAPRAPQIAFGVGMRQCLGAALARLEMRAGLEALLDRLPGLALDRSAEAPFISGLLFRSALSVPAVWDA